MTDLSPESYTHQELVALAPDARVAYVEAYLASSILAFRSLDSPPFDGSAKLADLGIDSLQIVEIKFGLDQLIGLELDAEIIISNPTLHELAVQSAAAAK